MYNINSIFLSDTNPTSSSSLVKLIGCIFRISFVHRNYYETLNNLTMILYPHFDKPGAQTFFQIFTEPASPGITVQLPTRCLWYAANPLLHEVLKPASRAQPAFSWKFTLWLFVNEARIGILLLYQYSRQLSCAIRLKKLEWNAKWTWILKICRWLHEWSNAVIDIKMM